MARALRDSSKVSREPFKLDCPLTESLSVLKLSSILSDLWDAFAVVAEAGSGDLSLRGNVNVDIRLWLSILSEVGAVVIIEGVETGSPPSACSVSTWFHKIDVLRLGTGGASDSACSFAVLDN